MEQINRALQHLDQSIQSLDQRQPVGFPEYLRLLREEPERHLRNVFQVFHDMVRSYVGQGVEEYPDDPESVNFLHYDFTRLLVENSDNPFFADRIFANRLMDLVESLRSGAQQNKIYIFDGPPGCGKSTFLNNLLRKFEEYANTEEGVRYEAVWRIERRQLPLSTRRPVAPAFADLYQPFLDAESGLDESLLDQPSCPTADRPDEEAVSRQLASFRIGDLVEIPCPSHDHPILVVPREYREAFLDELIQNAEFKWRLSTAKEYEWIFQDSACTVCSSIYEALLSQLKSPQAVLRMLHARPYRVNRRLGQGVSVFNPGDAPLRKSILTNPLLQRQVDETLQDSNQVRYLYSRYAKTNNGIYALMDIKSHNTDRLIELHNIISEGLHKVEDIEENVNSLFLAVMNPEDKKNIQGFQSFSDRIQYVHIPYVLDLKTEVAIYRNIFGRHIDESFLPMVLDNFARIIISTRLNRSSEAMGEWIEDPDEYKLYCDKNMQLLKMEIYTGYIPTWLSEEDRKKFTARRRRRILAESETEGTRGFSGRDAINIFNDLYGKYARDDNLISMSVLCNYFHKLPRARDLIPDGFLESLLRMYDYTVLQEVKESLYYYNEEQIARDIQNYLFALNFELGAVATCTFTGDRLEINEALLSAIERRLLGDEAEESRRLQFRKDTQQEYTSRTLTQEIVLEGKSVTETELYHALHERYVYNLKEKVLDPLLENENFRRAIKDYDQESFRTYDRRIREDVTFLMNNLRDKFGYTEKGAQEVCIYVIDNDLAASYAKV
jgi:predicted Ser/Thr protein kinase